MKVFYKCWCMPREKEIEVTDRPPHGDVVLWMQHVVGGAILVDHRGEFPRCSRDTVEYVKIPVDEHAPGIGQKPPLSS